MNQESPSFQKSENGQNNSDGANEKEEVISESSMLDFGLLSENFIESVPFQERESNMERIEISKNIYTESDAQSDKYEERKKHRPKKSSKYLR